MKTNTNPCLRACCIPLTNLLHSWCNLPMSSIHWINNHSFHLPDKLLHFLCLSNSGSASWVRQYSVVSSCCNRLHSDSCNILLRCSISFCLMHCSTTASFQFLSFLMILFSFCFGLWTSHTTNRIRVGLIVVEHIPIVEIHIPSEIGNIWKNRGGRIQGIIIRKSDPARYGFLRNQSGGMPQCGWAPSAFQTDCRICISGSLIKPQIFGLFWKCCTCQNSAGSPQSGVWVSALRLYESNSVSAAWYRD